MDRLRNTQLQEKLEIEPTLEFIEKKTIKWDTYNTQRQNKSQNKNNIPNLCMNDTSM